MFTSSKKAPPLQWVNCLNGTIGQASELPLLLPPGSPSPSLSVTRAEKGVFLEPIGNNTFIVNGSPARQRINIQDTATLQLSDSLLVLSLDQVEPFKSVDTKSWILFDAQSGDPLGEFSSDKLLDVAAQLGRAPDTLACTPQGLEIGFTLSQIAPLLSARSADETHAKITAKPTLTEEQNRGAHICPVCWTRFDSGDALSIAVHENLRGDPILGSDARLRFQPTRFNDQSLALDPMGLACTDIACPHCRRQLPPGYLDMPHRIISLIGAPSAGKSYYLAALTRVLQDRLPNDFQLAFKDGDPSGNMLLNQMRNTLFSAATPEEALIGKTALEGATYEKLPRLGRMVSLPRPFIYSISRPGQQRQEMSMILYDNAGEHFEPGIDIHESPGALHVANSAGLIFLFDPTANARFKAKLIGAEDPQFTLKGRVDQQDSILSEMETRIKRVLGLSQNQRITAPLAFVVGKSDTWEKLLSSPLEPVIKDFALDLSAIQRNSARVREVLVALCPGLVASAESLCSQICYFAASSFGHMPVLIQSGLNKGRIAPDPQRLVPAHVEEPVYWLLHLTAAEMFPAARTVASSAIHR
ncbi:MAG: hypothetical protein D4R66_03770 [Opitutales bacterium]|jgi:hypothetical protein|nr:MAG: hypothetical protein D4R66_03770 [Opitutales bacterium]